MTGPATVNDFSLQIVGGVIKYVVRPGYDSYLVVSYPNMEELAVHSFSGQTVRFLTCCMNVQL